MQCHSNGKAHKSDKAGEKEFPDYRYHFVTLGKHPQWHLHWQYASAQGLHSGPFSPLWLYILPHPEFVQCQNQ
jgi:hypothetical protein